MKTFAQILLVIFPFVGFLFNVYKSIHGKPAEEPSGYLGFIASLLVMIIFYAMYYFSGAFSEIFR